MTELVQVLAASHAALSTFDAGQVLSGAIGATVGALVGVIGTATTSSRARRYEARQASAAALERAIENLLRSLVNLTAATDAWERAVKVATWVPGDRPSGRPHPAEVSIALELVKLRALPNDHDATARLSAAWDRIATGEEGTQSTAYGLFARAIVAWRAGEGLPSVDNALRQAIKVAENGLVDDEADGDATV